ncbi:hypothetical protein MGMO_4c00120 [Methyloglobulus morosus KoM1]|uniref:Uncharacterized protein n=1 Tax=Methyloglobulus morosus KoM1 TaxID=1116472 RepID=V5BLB9_9GAMM|nr:right-handed parallel beta-helix repeat-containing protein [Methyloglobulus morosus]ESS74100.1 hypothetical protein MGMO_4c00120 [Methyloglobulus morosus KoM1]
MKFCYSLLTLVSLCYCTNAMAVTYYVDALNGNDSWSGTTSSISGTNGPWQSIAKVNATPLLPGDQVLFSCGQTWYETLKPSGNGTSTAKIYFGSYPSQCTNKPKITGFRSVAGYNWRQYQGNIWKTTLPQNLIINGNFSASVANWAKWPSDASQTFATICPTSVAGCMDFLAGTSASTSLANSNPFPLVGGKKYALTLSFYAASDTSINLIVRENGNSYRTLGLNKKVSGIGQWQTVNAEFTATQTLPNARLDIQVPTTKRIYIRYAQIQESGVQPTANMVLFDNDPVAIAHHPNVGHDPAQPESVYFRTVAASPVLTNANGSKFSAQIAVPDLELPTGVTITNGMKFRLRDADWEINDFAVTGVAAGTISFAPNTAYPLSKAGWGFYFYDALWMLDSAGEWFYDSAAQTLYVWTPTNENPGNRISFAAIDTAVDLRAKTSLTVDNLEIDGAATGIDIVSSSNITLQHLNIHNVTDYAINAQSSNVPTIANNLIDRVGVNGISAINSTNALIDSNELAEIGQFVKAGKSISIPLRSGVSIFGGLGSIVSNNSLSDIGGYGIRSQRDNLIETNLIQRSCAFISDCSAIYVDPASLRTTVQNNLVLDVLGNIDGTPDGTSKLANGIYLDDGASGMSVTGNTVNGTTNAIHIHNGSQNTVSQNLLYGNQDRLIWQQEDRVINGGLQGNIITGNQLFPTTNKGVAILNNSLVGNVDKFASYDSNHYSTIYSPVIVSEYGTSSLTDYTFLDWQKATTSTNVIRNNDLNGDNPAPITTYSLGTVGQNIVPDGDFSAGLQSWAVWNAGALTSSIAVEGCLPVSVNCGHVTAGASTSLVNSPKFAIIKGKTYRVSFDMKSTYTTGFLWLNVRFAGPTKYGSLKTDSTRVTPTADWKRYSFVFEASDTAANPALNDQGARFDINEIPAGQQLWIGNLEIAPMDLGSIGPIVTEMLVNKTDITTTADCPSRIQNPSLCSSYVNFPEGTVVTWPMSIPPRSGRIVFTQNLTLLDTDGDGIANSQDSCATTAKGLAVNLRGCSLLD